MSATLSRGNPKTGSSVLTYSRAPGVTCPGSSEWCAAECYAKQSMAQYANTRNQWTLNAETDAIPVIPKGEKLLRIHVSGDFDTPAYVMGWYFALKNRPDVTAWAYTRSWTVPAMLKSLEKLRSLPNVQLFASVDASMVASVPDGWRIAFIVGDDRFKGLTCPEQTGDKADCVSCGYCFKGKRNNVAFITHPKGRRAPGKTRHSRLTKARE